MAFCIGIIFSTQLKDGLQFFDYMCINEMNEEINYAQKIII